MSVPSLPTPLCFLLGFFLFHSHYSSSSVLPIVEGKRSPPNSVLNADIYRGNPFSTMTSNFPITLTLSLAF